MQVKVFEIFVSHDKGQDVWDKSIEPVNEFMGKHKVHDVVVAHFFTSLGKESIYTIKYDES